MYIDAAGRQHHDQQGLGHAPLGRRRHQQEDEGDRHRRQPILGPRRHLPEWHGDAANRTVRPADDLPALPHGSFGWGGSGRRGVKYRGRRLFMPRSLAVSAGGCAAMCARCAKRMGRNPRLVYFSPRLLRYNTPMSTGSATSGMLPSQFLQLPRWLEGTGDSPRFCKRSRRGEAATIDGAWNSSASLVTATLGLHAPATLLAVLAHPRDLDFWDEDIFSFSGIRAVPPFPPGMRSPTADTVLDEIGGKRLPRLAQLESDQPPKVLLTTIQALLQPVPNREQLAAASQTAARRPGNRRSKNSRLAGRARLSTHGSGRNRRRIQPAQRHPRRFSPDAEAPYRLEFVGDEIESIRQFSPETQRAWATCKRRIEITARKEPRPEPGS